MLKTGLSTPLRWSLAAALAAGILGWLLREADFAALAVQAAQVPAVVWGLAAAALTGGYLCRAQRVKDEWRRDSLGECWRLVMLHNTAVLLLPMRGGEAGYLYLVQRRFGAGLLAGARSLLLLRLQDAAVLCLLALLVVPAWDWPWRLAALSAAVGLLIALRQPLRHVLRRWPVLAGALLRPGCARSWILSATNWTLKLLALGGLLALLLPLPWADALRAALAGEVAGALPLQGPAGLGTYEAAVWAGASLALRASEAPAGAVTPGQVALAALLVHGFALACALAIAAAVHAWPAAAPPARRSMP
jgi:hypothetical protein